MLRRHFTLIVSIIALAWVVWLLRLWQPARQVRLHTESFLESIESRDWKSASERIADDYSDRWGHDKRELVERSREVFAQFLFITLEARDLDVVEINGRGEASAHLTLRGAGGPLAQLAMQRAAELRAPFVFTWRQQSWKPWDWTLVRVEQPELKVD
ncbi:MAG: hypothetical protein ABMA13_07260 [Chthoniobacteraceae bacterium]